MPDACEQKEIQSKKITCLNCVKVLYNSSVGHVYHFVQTEHVSVIVVEQVTQTAIAFSEVCSMSINNTKCITMVIVYTITLFGFEFNKMVL